MNDNAFVIDGWVFGPVLNAGSEFGKEYALETICPYGLIGVPMKNFCYWPVWIADIDTMLVCGYTFEDYHIETMDSGMIIVVLEDTEPISHIAAYEHQDPLLLESRGRFWVFWSKDLSHTVPPPVEVLVKLKERAADLWTIAELAR